MTDIVKSILIKFVLPILVPVFVGLGSAVITAYSMTKILDQRVTNIETQIKDYRTLPSKIENMELIIERHEKALERDFLRHEQIVANISVKTDDQEKRLTRLETLVNETQSMLSEIRTDIKILLREKSDPRNTR